MVTKYGPVQVTVTLHKGRITDVQWLALPHDRQRSAYISKTAAPILRSEVLAAQSARIDLVSGATYTSDAWANSAQSALARGH
ncbi:MAG: FMN-binding protein [Solirubrobacteraceae bacterium]|nr:FMN-binding protein [Solirubrobacteraceae bacterium]